MSKTGRAPEPPTPPEVADIASPIGTFRVIYRDHTILDVDLLERGIDPTPLPEGTVRRRAPFPKGSPPEQLAEYFLGRRRQFEVSVEPRIGTAFDREVWNALLRVPAGRTITYGELAKRSGHPGAARAVGGAMHRNPIPIVVPCHRVVGSAGELTGFGLGLWRKRWLLDREGAWPLKAKSIEGPRGSDHQRTLDVDPEVPVPKSVGGRSRPHPA